MKRSLLPLWTAFLFLVIPVIGHSQGLLALTQSSDYEENIPFSVILSLGIGYDHTEYSGLTGDVSDDVESSFLQSSIGLRYGKNHSQTKWNIGADLGTIYYFDKAERGEDLFYNTKLSLNVSHAINRRLTIGNNLYVTYEIEPDYNAGVTTGRRSGQYIYGYNNTSISYAWSRRITTTTGYTIDGIKYVDDDLLGQLEDRITHTFSQMVSFSLSRRTALTLEYRFRFANYDNPPEEVAGEVYVNPDYTSHYVLAGVDHAWSDRASISVRAGAEMYQSDRRDDVAPYVEGAFNYAISRKTMLRWYVQAGYDGSELGLFDSRYSYRTGITASHQFTRRFSGYTGAHFVFSDFEGNEDAPSADEAQLNVSLGFVYNFWRNLSLDGNYSYTTVSADDETRDYDRHRVSLGLNAAF